MLTISPYFHTISGLRRLPASKYVHDKWQQKPTNNTIKFMPSPSYHCKERCIWLILTDHAYQDPSEHI